VQDDLIGSYRDYAGEMHGSDYVEGDPLFVNASGADSHLQPSSPAVDKGSPVDAPTNNFDGHPQPQDGDEDGTTAYEIGA
jgi:hypothetical protein